MTDDYYAIVGEPVASGADGQRTATVRLSGEFDLAACEELGETLSGVIGAGEATRIVVDVAGVEFIDSEAIGVLLEGHGAARRAGLAFRIVNARGLVRRVFDVIGMDELIEPHEAPAGPAGTRAQE